jgi:hypothetical protein
MSKLNVVSPNYKSHPATFTSEMNTGYVDDDDDNDAFPSGNPNKKKKVNKRLQEAEAEGIYLWEATKHYLLRPGVAGGLVGLSRLPSHFLYSIAEVVQVNLGLLAGTSRAFYTQPHLRRDRTALSSAVAATIALISVEGYAAEKYRKTPRGQAEEKRARKEGTLIYKHLHEQVLRPGVLGGLVGLGKLEREHIWGYSADDDMQ